MKKIKREVIDLVPVGLWLVSFDRIWDINEETGHERISDIEPMELKRVTSKSYLSLCEDVVNKDINWNTDHVNDDTHDFRPRLFKTKKEALEHIKYTVNRFKNPQPWESFIKF